MEENNIKTYRVKGVRVLLDGTVKEYYYNKKYKVKYPDREKKIKLENLTSEQKQEIWEKFLGCMECKDIAIEYNTNVIVIKNYIDSRKLELLEVVKKSKQVNNV